MSPDRGSRFALALTALPVVAMASLFVWVGTAADGPSPETPITAAESFVTSLPRLCEANVAVQPGSSPAAECWSSFVSVKSVSVLHGLRLGQYIARDRDVVAVEVTCRRDRLRTLLPAPPLPPSESGMTEPTSRPCGFILIFDKPLGHAAYELVAAVPRSNDSAGLKALRDQPVGHTD
jgi:hypothetical protein